ncbi:hypothetical protein LQF12_10680 [Ruania suaedae]|uniref:hypothetical protein n=1 Tax=Ruania suaedae TaxID=2897774 RepID=UPI001E54781D|nr:hypothetical protein [Ruania suaedae]UFU01978.1 hypothetical protein LQF12_10680 [Ruania suaedae]
MEPGESISITGHAFMDGCDDHAGNGTPYVTQSPLDSVRLELTQDNQIVATLDAIAIEDDGSFVTTLAVPDSLVAGPIVVDAPDVAGAEPLELTVTVP